MSFYASDILDDHGWRYLFRVSCSFFLMSLGEDGTETKVLQNR